MASWLSPVGPMIRPPDLWALEGGAYHAARSSDGRSRRHEGLDLLAAPGSPILAPFDGFLVRIADPYPQQKDASLLGLLLQSNEQPELEVKILYCDPIRSLIGKPVSRGALLARSQSLQSLYPGIRDHIHVEVWISGMRVDPTSLFYDLGSAAAPPISA